jgi:hypothetical protein
MNKGKLRWLIALCFLAVLLLVPAAGAFAAVAAPDVVAQETPYEAPDIEEREPPGWLKPLEPLAALPLWGQAAVLSAGVAGMFFVVPAVFRWVWNIGGADREASEVDDAPDD